MMRLWANLAASTCFYDVEHVRCWLSQLMFCLICLCLIVVVITSRVWIMAIAIWRRYLIIILT